MYNLKKIVHSVIWLALAAVMLFAFAACGQSITPPDDKQEIYVNGENKASGMLTINQKEFNTDSGTIMKENGIGFTLPKIMQNLKDEGSFNTITTEFSIFFLYVSLNQSEKKSEDEQVIPNMVRCYAISRITADDGNAEVELENLKATFKHTETITAVGNVTYYFSYNDDYSSMDFSDTDKANIKAILESREELLNSICLFPPVVETMSADINMNNFSAQTIDGDTLTQDCFSDYEITMVNIWTTWCGPCIGEMPELQELYSMLPENANVMTICADANEELELAKEIMTKSGCELKTLIPSDELVKSLLDKVIGYPTTIFVDSFGNVIGEPQIGVPGGKEGVPKNYLRMIEERMRETTEGFGETKQ